MTHVIVSQVSEKLCKGYVELNPEVNIVNVDWFVDSCKENQLLECKPYCVYNNALSSVKTPKKRSRPEKTTEAAPSSAARVNSNNNLTDSDLNACLSQYLNAEAAALIKHKQPPPQQQQQQPQLQPPQQQQQLQQQQSLQQSKNDSLNTTVISKQQIVQEIAKKCIQNELFSNKIVRIVGFEDSEAELIENLLRKKGAFVLNEENNERKYLSNVDFTIFPATIPEALPYGANYSPVTVYWMRKCLEKKQLFVDDIDMEENLYFQPVAKFAEAAKYNLSSTVASQKPISG